MPPEILSRYVELLASHPWNSGTLYALGLEARAELERARAGLASLLGAQPSELVFTSGGTEANNLAVHACAGATSGGSAWVSSTAHPSLANPLRGLRDRGWRLWELPVTVSGALAVDPLGTLEKPDLVAVEWVNNELGFVQPLEALLDEVARRAPRARVIVDGVQGFAKLPTPKLDRLHAFSLGAHKIGGPPGCGALLLHGFPEPRPLMFGGGQEGGWRPGTVAVPAVAAFLAAAQRARGLAAPPWPGEVFSGAAPKPLRDPATPYSPYIWTLDTSPVEGEVLMHHLEAKDIVIGLGSACSSHKRGLSPAHRAAGLSEHQSRRTLRVSFAPGQPASEVAGALAALVVEWRALLRYFN